MNDLITGPLLLAECDDLILSDAAKNLSLAQALESLAGLEGESRNRRSIECGFRL